MLRLTRTQRRPCLRSTVTRIEASRLVEIVSLAERREPRLRTLAETEVTCATGQPSEVRADWFGQPSERS